MSEVNLTNEFGNKIRLTAERRSIENPEGTSVCAGVFYTIEGPTSLMENHITLDEARALYQLLGGII